MMFVKWHIEAKSQAFFTTEKAYDGWGHTNSKEKKRCSKQQRNTKCSAICYNKDIPSVVPYVTIDSGIYECW